MLIFITAAIGLTCLFPCLGRWLNSTMLKKSHAVIGTDCVFQCLNDQCCRSVNFRREGNVDGEENCLLFHAVATEQPENFCEEEHSEHITLLQPKRVSIKRNRVFNDEFAKTLNNLLGLGYSVASK